MASRQQTRKISGCRAVLLLAIAVAVAAVLLRYATSSHSTDRKITIERLGEIQQALDRYCADNGGLVPTAKQGLDALLVRPEEPPEPPNWCGPYVTDEEVLNDGWGHRFHYTAPGGGDNPRPYDLWSRGSDNASGGKGDDADIKSWEPSTLVP